MWPPAPHPRARGALLGFRGEFLEQVLAAGDRRAVQISGAAQQQPGVVAAEQGPKPRAESPPPVGHHPHGRGASAGSKRLGAEGRGAGRRGRGLEDEQTGPEAAGHREPGDSERGDTERGDAERGGA